MSHLRSADGTVICTHEDVHEAAEPAVRLVEHAHDDHGQEHSHGLVDRSILRSRAGIRAVSWSLGILTVTALAQAFIYTRTLSVALLADLIHNFGDALTAIPLGQLAAQVRLRAGSSLQSPALVADGKHARVDGFVSLGVLASAAVVAIGLNLADPIIGLVITLVILQITWESWRTISSTDPGEMLDEHEP